MDNRIKFLLATLLYYGVLYQFNWLNRDTALLGYVAYICFCIGIFGLINEKEEDDRIYFLITSTENEKTKN